MRRQIAWVLLAALSLGLCGCGARADSARPLACISLILADDSLMQTTADTFVAKMEDNGYRTRVAYCDSKVETQLSQIQNFIALGAAVIAVDCAGNSEAYEDVFAQAMQRGCKVMVLGSSGAVANCDVQSKSYPVFQGMRMCELLGQYLDEQYPDAPPESVAVLLLEMSNKQEHARIGAGYRLIGERFLRYYDSSDAAFIRFETARTVYYRNADGERVPVDEPAGGLILGRDGLAQLNPFYDGRVKLCYAVDRNIPTNLQGQQAVDAFMTTPEGAALRVVVGVNGDAAVGATERLLYYREVGIINAPIEQLAVFGSDDSLANRTLIAAAIEGRGLFRGFVCGEYTQTKVNRMLDMILSDTRGVYLSTASSRSRIVPGTTDVGLVTVTNSWWQDPDVFFIDAEKDGVQA